MQTLQHQNQIIASLLYQYDESIIDQLSTSDFKDEGYRNIFEKIKELGNSNIIEVSRAAKVSQASLLEILNSFFSHEAVQDHIVIIKNDALKKEIEIALENIKAKDLPLDSILNELNRLSEIKSNTRNIDLIISVKDAADLSLAEALFIRENKDKRLFYPFDKLNYKCGALMPGRLVTIAGRTGAGKSALALQIAIHIGRHHKVTYVSLEMTPQEMAARVISSRTGIDTISLSNGNITDEQVSEIREENEKMCKEHLSFTNKGRSIKEITRLIKKENPELIIIDSINLMRSQGENERVRLINITRELKQIALEYKVPICLLCQLNRGADKTVIPTLSEIKESSSIEEDSDLCLLLGWIQTTEDFTKLNERYLELYKESICSISDYVKLTEKGDRLEMLVIAKSRNGATGMIPMRMFAKEYIFTEV